MKLQNFPAAWRTQNVASPTWRAGAWPGCIHSCMFFFLSLFLCGTNISQAQLVRGILPRKVLSVCVLFSCFILSKLWSNWSECPGPKRVNTSLKVTYHIIRQTGLWMLESTPETNLCFVRFHRFYCLFTWRGWAEVKIVLAEENKHLSASHTADTVNKRHDSNLKQIIFYVTC